MTHIFGQEKEPEGPSAEQRYEMLENMVVLLAIFIGKNAGCEDEPGCEGASQEKNFSGLCSYCQLNLTARRFVRTR